MANPLICIFNPITTLIDEIPSSSVFSGAGAAFTPIVLNAQGVIDPSLLGEGTSATAGELLVAGALVNLYSNAGSLFMQNAYAAATGTSPSGAPYPVAAVGFVTTNVSISNSALVLFSGVFTYGDPHSEFSASSIGSEVYLSTITPGGITLTRPSGAGQLQQEVGVVVGFSAPNFVQVNFATQPQPAFNNFDNITSGTNTTATMTVGTGATLGFTGSGVVDSNTLFGIALGGTTPTTGWVLTATSASTADWAAPSGGGGTPGGTPTQLQYNSAGTFAGASNSSVSGTGAVVLGNANDGSVVSTTAFTVAASGGIGVSAQDWYSSNEGTVIAQMKTSGRLTVNGCNIISNVSIGGFPALTVIGGNAGSPDIADFTTAIGASPSNTKVIWIDYNGNLNLLQGIKDHTGSLGTSGQALTTTGTQTLWASVTAAPGGSTGDIQYNNAGVLAGSASTITAAGTITVPAGQSVNTSLVTSATKLDVITSTTAGLYIDDSGFVPDGFLLTDDSNNLTISGGVSAGGIVIETFGQGIVLKALGSVVLELGVFGAGTFTLGNGGSETISAVSGTLSIDGGTINVSSGGGGINFATATTAQASFHVGGTLLDGSNTPGTSGQALLSTVTGVAWGTPTAAAGGTPTQIQYNLAGAFAGIAGSAVTAAGAVSLAPTGTGVALSVTGDGAASNVQNWYMTGETGANWGAAFVDYGDTEGLQLGFQAADGSFITMDPTNGLTQFDNSTAGYANLTFASGMFVRSASGNFVTVAGDTSSFNGSNINLAPTSGSYDGSTSAVALTVEGSTLGHITEWYTNGPALVAYFDASGDMFIAPAPTASTGVAALNVTGDAFSDNIVDFYQNGFPATPAVYVDGSGSFWVQNVVTPAHTIQLYDTTFEILSATGQAQASLSVVPHFHLSDTTPTVMDLYTSYLGFGATTSDIFLSRLSAGVFGVGQTIGTATGTLATGGFATSIQTQTTTYTATEFDHTINCNGTFTLTLPTAGIVVGQEYYIKNIGIGVITVSSTVNIDFALTVSLNTQGQSVTVQWDGTQYWIY